MKQDEPPAEVPPAAGNSRVFTPEALRTFFTPPVGELVILKLRATQSLEIPESGVVDEAPFPDISRLLTRVRLTRARTADFVIEGLSGSPLTVTRVEVYPCEEYLQIEAEDGPEFAFDIGLLIERTPLAEAIATLIADAHTILRSHSGTAVLGMTIEARTNDRKALIALIPITTTLTADDVLTSAPSVIAAVQHLRRADAPGSDIDTAVAVTDDAPEPREPQMTRVLDETQRLVGPQRHREVTMFYATNRLCVQELHTCDRAPEIGFGRCLVAIPATHRLGALEHPRMLEGWKWLWNPDKHVMITDRERLNSPAWTREVAQHVRRKSRSELVVLVHGYNTDFDEAIRRAAQIYVDVAFAGVPIVFSWPSLGETLNYLADKGNAEYSVKYLADFLAAITRAHVDTVHVIAHSMGNRVLLPALKELAATGNVHIGETILTAPDFDTGVLDQMIATIRPLSDRMTMYVSARDIATGLSKTVYKNPVAGNASDYFYYRPDHLDTVDATPIASILSLNHFYSAEHPLGLQELREVVEYRLPAESRWAIEPRPLGGWQFKASHRR
ncbi:MAG: alpha/beta hydrolase [Acidobacteriota bacterium]|nr:alpha/beta hydrolase [Acidobacteriota bacterium]